ncbi:MAG: hypothetical protein Q7K45_05890 [Nanoarchaeota archaeon]|nr:hypothetical protein [Nanoarchaeota archaeon]
MSKPYKPLTPIDHLNNRLQEIRWGGSVFKIEYCIDPLVEIIGIERIFLNNNSFYNRGGQQIQPTPIPAGLVSILISHSGGHSPNDFISEESVEKVVKRVRESNANAAEIGKWENTSFVSILPLQLYKI